MIITTGARWRTIDVPGEHEYKNKGVAYCPHCDGPLFKGKRVAVIGGGNSGVEAAIDLAGVVAHVTLIEFDTKLRADAVLQDKLRSLPNVDVILNALSTEVHGDGSRVNALSYRDRATDELKRLELEGIFVQIGRAQPARRNRDRRPRADLGAGRVRSRRLHHRAVQADHHRHRRRRHRRLGRLRPPDP